ncbi:MAG: N-6 DNA methylase [Bacteroidaceae bacterium]|nr:N-6 DNA methylase [Bacteroidaceae bacterium]
MKLSEVLKGSELSLKQFTQEQITALENRIQEKDLGDGVKPYAKCIVRDKEIMIKPEEIVRQLFAEKLMGEYGYPKNLIEFEKPIKSVGRKKENVDFADIVVYTDATKQKVYIVFEIKRPDEKNVNEQKKQLESYCLVEGASLGALINGDDIERFFVNSQDKNNKTQSLKPIPKLPRYGETLDDVLNTRHTYKYLVLHDRLRIETLKKVISDLEQRFSANDSSDKSFDEILKLVYCKLFDEYNHNDDADYLSREVKRQQKQQNNISYYDAVENVDDDDFNLLEFRAKQNEDEKTVFDRVSNLFDNAQKHWKGAFAPNTKLDMQPSTVKSCVIEFQNVKLFNSNLEVVDEAFEYLVNKNQKGEMGQYFTPRYVIDMCVRMLNPQKDESMIDTASGSCGFPMHTVLQVWNKQDNLTTAKREQWEKDYVRDKVFAIDFSEKAVRVGKILNIITGDGNTNVLYLNTLDYTRWDAQFKNNPDWWAKYNEGFTRLEGLRTENNSYSKFNFDILMANPPFAGDLDDRKILSLYNLSKNAKGQTQNKVGRDILFIERNLNFLKPGGRMAIVLPQGRFNNSSDKYIREYIAERCRILAVVGLHGNVFKPHTGTKTSVIFVQKWTSEEDKYFPNINDKEKVTYRIHLTDGNKRVTRKEMEDDIKNREFRLTSKQVKIEADEKYQGDKHQLTINLAAYDKLTDDDKEMYQEHNKWCDYNVYTDYNIFFATMQEPSKDNSGDKIYVTEHYYDVKDYVYNTVQKFFDGNNEVSKEEYEQGLKDKSKKRTLKTKIETATASKSKKYREDEFESIYGTTDTNHPKRWIPKAVTFVLKKGTETESKSISLQDYFALPDNEKAKYKEEPILGQNTNETITNQEYEKLSTSQKKYYLVSIDVKDYTERVKDTHGHIFVKHDLFNHDPQLEPIGRYCRDGIAEAFAEFAKKEGLSFF